MQKGANPFPSLPSSQDQASSSDLQFNIYGKSATGSVIALCSLLCFQQATAHLSVLISPSLARPASR